MCSAEEDLRIAERHLDEAEAEKALMARLFIQVIEDLERGLLTLAEARRAATDIENGATYV